MIIIIAAAAFAIWIYLLLGRGGFWRMRDPAAAGRDTASVVAVIPARNEADLVATAIASLAAQVPIVLVDDASDDGTADAARAAASPDVLRVIEARPLPAGWTGKMWAVSEGVHAAGT